MAPTITYGMRSLIDLIEKFYKSRKARLGRFRQRFIAKIRGNTSNNSDYRKLTYT